MSGVLNGLGIDNGFTNWWDAHRNALIGLGSGLAGGQNFGQGVANGVALAGQGAKEDSAYAVQQKAEAARQASINQTTQWLKKNYPQFSDLPVDQGFQLASQLQAKQESQGDPSSTYQGRLKIGQEQGLSGNDLMTYALTSKLPGGNQTARAGVGQPIAFRNKKDPTQMIYVQPMTVGPAVETISGQPPANPADWEPAPYDLAAQKAGGTQDATTAAAARASLPGVEQAYAITKKAIAQLSSDPSVQAGQKENFSNFPYTPIPEQSLPILPKSDRANFQNVIDQLSGQAFLNIRQALKGAGQVTDFEGAKGEDAISRMKQAASRGDSAAFDQAVSDFNDALDNGMRLLRQQAQGGFAAGQVPSLGQGTGDPELDKALQQYGQ